MYVARGRAQSTTGKVLTRFRYHRHYFKYFVRYPYGDDAKQFRTLREHHVRSKWVPKLALIIILFILSIDKNQVSLLQNHPGEPHGHKTGYAAQIYPGIRSLALSCFGGLSTESRKLQGARHFTQAIPKTIFQSKSARALIPDHITTLWMVIGGVRSS